MQTKKPCVCGRAYWPAQAWQHEVCKVNAAVKPSEVLGVLDTVTAAPKFNRNAYMREYMRKRRAKARG